MPKRSEVIEKKSKTELSKTLEINLEEYFEKAGQIINRLEERRKVNEDFLDQIETFIKYAKDQVKNKNLSEEARFKYLDLIEEEESLHDRIKEDLKRNNKLIKSIKKSTDTLFR